MATLNQIFHWAVENTPPRDPNSTEPQATPQPIDKKWLDLILKSDASKMKELVEVYTDGNASTEEKEAALEELEFFVQMIDNANDLPHPSVNGLTPILQGIKTNEKAVLRMRCAWVIATAIANNPKLQQLVLDLEGTKLIVESLKLEVEDKSRGSLEVVSKLVAIISSLLQHNARAQKEFWQLGGFRILFHFLKMEPNDLDAQKEQEKVEEMEEKDVHEIEEEKSSEKKSEEERKNIVATFDIVEVKERVSKRAQQLKRWNKNKKQDKLTEWMKLIRKIIFIMARLMGEVEQFKLAFAKEQDGAAVDILLNLLHNYLNDGELVEKIGDAFQGMLTASNATLQNYITGLLRAKNLKEHLEQVVSSLQSKIDSKDESYDHSYALAMYSDILSKLSIS